MGYISFDLDFHLLVSIDSSNEIINNFLKVSFFKGFTVSFEGFYPTIVTLQIFHYNLIVFEIAF